MTPSLVESAKTAALSVTPHPLGKPGGPGLWRQKGLQLPAYIQNVAQGILKSMTGTKDKSRAIAIAIGKIEDWAAGKGNVSAEVRAASRKAIAELKAKAAAVKAKIKESAEISDEQLAAEIAGAHRRLALLADLGLPDNGDGALADRILVEAAAFASDSPGAAVAALVEAGIFTENLHPRAGKGAAGGGRFIAKGSSGKDVRGVQRRVGARVDGSFGDRTKAAVERFQRGHNLTVDGVVGRQTVAALRGRRDAKRVKVGALTKADRQFLAGHVRGTGRKRKAPVVEAVGHASFLERVKGLQTGEIARLPDGGAVKHHATDDGRAVWTAGQPRSYATDGMGWGEQRRSPEEAVADAFTNSAASTDPESLGGSTRFSRYTAVSVNGQGAEFHGVDHNAQPLVRIGRGAVTPSSWPSVQPAPKLVEAREGARTNAAFERLHPRDRRGEFARKLGSLKPNEAHTFPNGTKVTAHGDGKGFTVEHADGKTVRVDQRFNDNPTREAAAQVQTSESAKRPVRDSPAGSGKSFAEGVSAAYNANTRSSGGGKSLDDFKVPGDGSISHKGTDPNGQAIRLRKERTGAFVVEKESASGSWLPNRFTDEKIAQQHFLAQVTGGNAGAAKETAGRLNLGNVTRGKGAAGKEGRAQLKTKLANLDVGKSATVNGKKVERVGMGQWKVNGRSFLSVEDALTAAFRP